MNAMILAAGFGTRLQSLTQNTPKALIKLADRTLLEIVLARLVKYGFNHIAINLHHHAEKMKEFIDQLKLANVSLYLSYEEKILGTGGGIKKMAEFFDANEPVLVHNVDVLTNLDLSSLFQKHIHAGAAATLAVQSRDSKRYLLFDGDGLLCGRVTTENPQPLLVRTTKTGLGFRAFNGLQVIMPKHFLSYKEDQFSSIDLYLDLAAQGEKVLEYRMEGCYWRDLGKPEELQQAEEDIHKGVITIE